MFEAMPMPMVSCDHDDHRPDQATLGIFAGGLPRPERLSQQPVPHLQAIETRYATAESSKRLVLCFKGWLLGLLLFLSTFMIMTLQSSWHLLARRWQSKPRKSQPVTVKKAFSGCRLSTSKNYVEIKSHRYVETSMHMGDTWHKLC